MDYIFIIVVILMSENIEADKPKSEQVGPIDGQDIIDQQEEKKYEEPIEIKPEQPQAEQLIDENKPEAEKFKSQGNEHFKQQDFQKAISCYQQALRYSPLNEEKLRAILYSNIAICLTKEDDHKDAIEYLKKSLKNDPTYMKAHLNIALAYEKTDNPEQALAAYKKIIELNPSDIKSQLKVKQLEKIVEQLNEKRKKEVLDGLKTIGNSVLGFFGLSLDNFKLNQTDNGGYNVSFKN